MKFNLSFTSVAFFLSFITMVLSCNNNNNQAAKNVVYYYPEKNIYYDSLQSNYYYSLDGSNTWDSIAFKGQGYGAVLGPKVAIERTGENIWVNNQFHRKQYNGVLLNIINERTILISKADSINKLKPVIHSQPKPEVMVEEAPKQKGLKKFFNKLFGKKKKPAEEKNNKTIN